MLSFEKVIENVRVVDAARNYWFIRTYGGQIFSSFKDGGYVGIGFNSIPISYLTGELFDERASLDKVKTHIESSSRYKKGEATKWAKQVLEFEHNVKEGDIVLVPSYGSHRILIGIVKGPTYMVAKPGTFFNSKNHGEVEEFPMRRRKVEWLKEITRNEMKGDFASLISTHRGLSSANHIYDRIETQLSDIFVREQKIYMRIDIDQDKDINARDLSNFLDGLTYFYDEFNNESVDFHNEDLLIKIKVQSKGSTILKSLGVAGVLGIAGMLALSNNNSVKASAQGVEGHSDGFLQSLSDFLDAKEERRQRRIIFDDSVAKLKAQSPTGITDTLTNKVNGDQNKTE